MSDRDHKPWVSWPEAAQIANCTVSTIEHYARVGRIEKRPRRGARPTLRRDSVIEFAAWRAARAERLARKRADQDERRQQAPPGEGWVTTSQAAEILDLSMAMVNVLAKQGRVPTIMKSRRHWLQRHDVEALAEARQAQNAAETAWLSYHGAAQLVGCTQPTIAHHVATGQIAQRKVARQLPSLRRDSVEAFASWWADRQRQRQEKREHRADPINDASQLRWPDEIDVWLSTTEVAIMFGITTAAVRQAAAKDRLPVTRKDGRLWFRRTHIEQIAAARSAPERLIVARPHRNATG